MPQLGQSTTYCDVVYYTEFSTSWSFIAMRLLCNFVNKYTNSCKCFLNIYMNMVANTKEWIVFDYNNSQ